MMQFSKYKLIMKNSLILLFSILFLISCSEEVKKSPNSIKGLKTEKIKLEKTKDSLVQKINEIETKLAELDPKINIPLVSVIEVKLADFNHYVSVQGNTKTDQNITLRPQASGIITNVYVKEGDKVWAGKKLMQLDDAILKSSIDEVRNQFSLANTTYQRQKKLWDQKIGSEIEFLQAQNNKIALEKKITTLESQLKNYSITAPFNGIIDDLIANKGDLASPQLPLLRIMNLRNMYIEADVSENYLKSIKKGNTAMVTLASLGIDFEAKISQIGSQINPENRSFKIRININNKKGLIKLNLLADLKIKDFDAKKAIVIPSNLIQMDENGEEFVFILTQINDKNLIAKKLIKTEKNYEDKTLISEGLNENDLLVTEGSRNVSNAQEVDVIDLDKNKDESMNSEEGITKNEGDDLKTED